MYEIDEADGKTFIVALAYLDGQTLSKKIAESPLKLDEPNIGVAPIKTGTPTVT